MISITKKAYKNLFFCMLFIKFIEDLMISKNNILIMLNNSFEQHIDLIYIFHLLFSHHELITFFA